MTFIQPALFVLLPLVGVPILIHLINRRRHHTIHWGATMFLLTAKRMSRGMARVRHLAIMAMRMLAIFAIVFAVMRPMATGWLGSLTGGKPETVIILLDRSASMQQQDLTTGETKLSSGLKKLVNVLQIFDIPKPPVLIESTREKAYQLGSPEELLEVSRTGPTDSFADIPSMLQKALDYVSENQTGRTDIWICSDGQRGDWDPNNGRWAELAGAFTELQGIRFKVLNYSQASKENLSIQVQRAEPVFNKDKSELVLDFTITRSKDIVGPQDVSIELTINGARTVTNVRLDQTVHATNGYRVPLDQKAKIGWGKVEIPADSNNSDNAHFFAFAKPEPLKSAVVSDDPQVGRLLKIICETSSSKHQQMECRVVGSDSLHELDWEETALVLWQASMPTGLEAKRLESFLSRGRSVLFFPPPHEDSTPFQGITWGDWNVAPNDQPRSIGFWRNDDDLLKKTQEGDALPLDNLKIYQHRSIQGNPRHLAKLDSGAAFFSRSTAHGPGAYFCTTLPTGNHSNLSRNGIVLFAALHRAIRQGASTMGAAKRFVTGTDPAMQVVHMPPKASTLMESLAESRPYFSGVYGDDKQLIALNRSDRETQLSLLNSDRFDTLFNGLDYNIIDDSIGNANAQSSEIWRWFLMLMGLALFVEACLCLPPKLRPVANGEPKSDIPRHTLVGSKRSRPLRAG